MSTPVQSSTSLTSAEVTERNLQSTSEVITKQQSVLKLLEDYVQKVGLKTNEIRESYEALNHQLETFKIINAQIEAETVKREESGKGILRKAAQLTASSQAVLKAADQKSSALKAETEELEQALSRLKSQMEVQRNELEKGIPVSDVSQSLRSLHQQAADLAVKLSSTTKEFESARLKSEEMIEAHKAALELREKLVAEVETTRQHTTTLQLAQRATVSKCLGRKLTVLAKTYSLLMRIKAAIDSAEKVESARETVELEISKAIQLLKVSHSDTDDATEALRRNIYEDAPSVETMTKLMAQTEKQLSSFLGLTVDDAKQSISLCF